MRTRAQPPRRRHRRRRRLRVRERGARSLGVGVNVLPHATRELIELGLGAELAATAIPTAALVFFNRHGQRVFSEDRGVDAGYHWPQYSIHRGELLGILHRAVRDRLGPDRYHTGHHVAAVGGDTTRVWPSSSTAAVARGSVATTVKCWSDVTACIQSSAPRSTATRARRCGMGSRCGAGSPTAPRCSTGARWC